MNAQSRPPKKFNDLRTTGVSRTTGANSCLIALAHACNNFIGLVDRNTVRFSSNQTVLAMRPVPGWFLAMTDETKRDAESEAVTPRGKALAQELERFESSLDQLKQALAERQLEADEARQSALDLRAQMAEIRQSLFDSQASGELLREENRHLIRRLSDERTANMRLTQEHNETTELITQELTIAQELLGYALGDAKPPRRSGTMRKLGDEDATERRRADTMPPKANNDD